MNEPPPKPSGKAPANVPVELDDLVLELMAKDRDKRPWDAAIVGMKLRDLLLRYETNKPIEMVWPEEGTSAHNPTRTMDLYEGRPEAGEAEKEGEHPGSDPRVHADDRARPPRSSASGP